MKWGIQSHTIKNKITAFLGRFVGASGLYVFLVLTALALLAGAGEKWGK